MIISNKKTGYSSRRKYVQGKGFMDTIRNVGSYITQNKDLIAKPLIGAAGDLAAFGLTEAGKSVITHLINKKSKTKVDNSILDPKSVAILQSLMSNEGKVSSTPVTNIIGSGIKRF